MPYHHNDPLYQTSHSRISSFNDFEKNKSHEVEELKKMKRNFTKRGEIHNAPGERKHHYNPVTHKIDDLSADEVVDKLDALEEGHQHDIKNYMFFANLKTVHRLSQALLDMDPHQIDNMLAEHNWALDHIATSKDDIEEVFNWINAEQDEQHPVDPMIPQQPK